MELRPPLIFFAMATLAIAGALFSGCRPTAQPDTPAADSTPPNVQPLDLSALRSAPLTVQIAAGEIHRYELELEAGSFLQLAVDQHGVDVLVTLHDSASSEVVASDRPIDDRGVEPILAVAEAGGSYLLSVEAAGGAPGSYEIRLEAWRPASVDDRRRAALAATFSASERLSWDRDWSGATDGYREALAGWRQLGERAWEAETLERLGRVHAARREWEVAAKYHAEAATLFACEDDPRWEAIALHHLGLDEFNLLRLDRAVDAYERALPLRRRAADRRGEAITKHALAQAFQVQDQSQQALDTYAQALELFEEDRDPGLRAHTVHNLGVLYLSLGNSERARDYLEEAESAWAKLGDPARRAASLNQLGELHQGLGQLEDARARYQEALQLRREVGDRRGQAATLANIGRLRQAAGDSEAARRLYLQASEILKELGRPRSEARVLVNLGSLAVEGGRARQAIPLYRNAIELYHRAGDLTGEAEGLSGLARAWREEGELQSALHFSEQALEILEAVRPRAVSQQLRESFFATVQESFGFHIDLLAELHARDPEDGYDAQALLTSERARARSLLDLLAESGADVRASGDPELLREELRVQRELGAWEEQRLQLGDSPSADEERVARVESEVRRRLEQLEELRAAIRARHPRYWTLTDPLPARLGEIQRQLGDGSTLLLEYWLGESRSFVWTVSSDALTLIELAPRELIENRARRAYELLTHSHRREAETATRLALCELGRLILSPVAPQLGSKRLLVVSDGALHYIPFAALPDPRDLDSCSSARPLMIEHELTHLPSASALLILRQQRRGRQAASELLAIVADPVFEATDPRLESPAPAFSNGNPSRFPRLPFSKLEAETILALLPATRSFRALGFEASKEVVFGGRLADYRWVHFATHGVLDAEHPELSGIVLSRFDRSGLPRDGFLRAYELYGLDLHSDLVVLSACRTALGKQIRGEGILGLTRGFFYAGAARVMVSLWNVSDRATATLMGRFYRGLLEDGLRPAAALRQAQIVLWSDGERSAPFFWAGFVLQGEPN